MIKIAYNGDNLKKDEYFIKNNVYDMITELRVPIVDECAYKDLKIKSKNADTNVVFKFEGDESVIRGFLALADFHHTVVIKEDDEFFIPTESTLYVLKN